ncbi:hypothetical protein Xclt_21240 [Xanthomonas axonopodis pv. clitoriae]|uniref:Immunity protein 30 domain-containing protein n=1 Tax=Xanthomonas axonopodis pv. clitoriae TaxID=487828 RepID=A0AB73NXN9_9XANT|nr:hypothetical protein [Xanthomonas axonopodis]OOW75798.1 hypothetical protein Xclt_21240 [Xanthomonas axonopodis pv. clitoriae]
MNAYQRGIVVTDLDVLEGELLKAEEVLDTEYSFEKAEPSYVRCLEIISHAEHKRPQIVALITSLFSNGKLSDEPVAVLMHKLRWPEVRRWAEAELHAMENPKVNGRPLEKIIAAFNDDWENKEFYQLFAVK